MLKDPSVRKSIYASIIASVLVIVFVQPLLNYLGQFFVWLGDMLYQGLSDSFYREAARGHREKYSFSLLVLFLGIVSGLATMVTVRVFAKDREGGERKTRKKPKVALAFVTAVMVVDCLYMLSLNYAGFQMNATFVQRMRIIRPLVDESTYYQIDASWASMRNRNDYNSINLKINEIASQKYAYLPNMFWH